MKLKYFWTRIILAVFVSIENIHPGNTPDNNDNTAYLGNNFRIYFAKTNVVTMFLKENLIE